MTAILDLVEAYGPFVYGLLFLYTFAKSGALPLFAGYAAQAGALDAGIVAGATFAGGYLGDELRFWIARRHGAAWLSHRPRLKPLVDRATSLLTRYGRAYLFAYRYPKGLRTVGAFPVGLTDMPWRRFTPLNAASAATWTAVMVGLGYGFGPIIEEAVQSGFGVASVVLLVAFIAVAAVLWRRREPRAAA
ncbi:DedA family protein [Alsobacter sp. R-9]